MKKSACFDGCLVLASTALMELARLDNVSMVMATSVLGDKLSNPALFESVTATRKSLFLPFSWETAINILFVLSAWRRAE